MFFNESFQYVYDFDINTGSNPTGEFFKCSNSDIISVSTGQAAYDKGALISFDPVTHSVAKIDDFMGNSDQKIQGTPYYKNENIYVLSYNYDELYYYNHSALLIVDYNQVNRNIFVDGFQNVTGSLSVSENKLFYYSNNGDQYNIRVFDIDSGNVVATPNGYGTGHMTLADDGKFYGMRETQESGPFQIFRFDPVSFSSEIVLSFYGYDRPKPFENSLTAGSNGKLYGLAAYSDYDETGLIFEFSIESNKYSEIYDFTASVASNPSGELVEVGEGIFYAMSQNGGEYGGGTIFKFLSSTNSVEIVHNFNGTDGANPTGSLMLASNGKLYGMTTNGGEFNLGVLFEFDLATDGYAKILDFNGENGSHPRYSALTEICDEPEILTNPQDVEAVLGDTVMFTVSAESDDLTGYQWYQYSNPIIGATDDTLIIYGVTAGDEGKYFCEVSATCITVESDMADLTIVTGINETEAGIKLYPNPVNDILTLKMENSGRKINVKIFNYNGQESFSDVFQGNSEIKINTGFLKSGIYIIRVISEDKSVFAKIVKK